MFRWSAGASSAGGLRSLGVPLVRCVSGLGLDSLLWWVTASVFFVVACSIFAVLGAGVGFVLIVGFILVSLGAGCGAFRFRDVSSLFSNAGCDVLWFSDISILFTAALGPDVLAGGSCSFMRRWCPHFCLSGHGASSPGVVTVAIFRASS